MAEPFKAWINADSLGLLATELSSVYADFDATSFVANATDGLEALELKDRVRHSAAVLRAHLPEDWSSAVAVLTAAAQRPSEDALYAMRWWPVLQVVEDFGLDAPQVSVPALRILTGRFSAEFAIRPYLVRHPELTWRALESWIDDPSEHPRRLVSEGTRPRLPWGSRLADTPVGRGLPLCERLLDDPELYVRRSVANHLNDVCKDDPALAIATATRWIAPRTETRTWIVRHGLRTLLKAGDPQALALFGFGPPEVDVDGPTLDRDQVPFGESVEVSITLTSRSATEQALQVEWVVHYVRKKGTGSKVFRGPKTTLQPGQSWTPTKKLALKPVTTRRHYPGTHRVAVQVNGQVLGEAAFELVGGDG